MPLKGMPLYPFKRYPLNHHCNIKKNIKKLYRLVFWFLKVIGGFFFNLGKECRLLQKRDRMSEKGHGSN